MAGIQNLRPWKPGQSGNPGGRPKKRILDEALLSLLEQGNGEDALAIASILIKRAKQGDLRACQLIAERTQGKPEQAMQFSGPDGGALQIQNMTTEQIDQRIAELLEKWKGNE